MRAVAADLEQRYVEAMSVAAHLPPGEIVTTADQRVILHGIPWAHYEIMLAVRGEAPLPRMTFLRGELELMSPSRAHESIKTLIARLLEAYAIEAGLPLNGYGSWTVKSALKERGAEPDECYVLGDIGSKERPDIAIEVCWTSGGVDKLETYRGLDVPEVWFWKEGVIHVHALRSGAYEQVEASVLLPGLDIELVNRYASWSDQSAAVREFLTTIRQRG